MTNYDFTVSRSVVYTTLGSFQSMQYFREYQMAGWQPDLRKHSPEVPEIFWLLVWKKIHIIDKMYAMYMMCMYSTTGDPYAHEFRN